jgi:hypothetical protein
MSIDVDLYDFRESIVSEANEDVQTWVRKTGEPRAAYLIQVSPDMPEQLKAGLRRALIEETGRPPADWKYIEDNRLAVFVVVQQ